MKYLLIPFILFFFSGCCFSFVDSTCVIERLVPGPTNIVYKPCEIDNIPDVPVYYGEPINFKIIQFDDYKYFGLTEIEAKNLSINYLNEIEYIKKLQNIINEFKVIDTNITK